MSHCIEIPIRRLDALFGNAYPSLKPIPIWKKTIFIKEFVTAEVGPQINVDAILDCQEYKFEVGDTLYYNDNVSAYKIALALENWLKSQPRLQTLSPPRWWNKLFWSTLKSDIFCVDDIPKSDLLKWLAENNLKSRDFQFFSKFGKDTSIAFCNNNIATMFKLKFAVLI